MSDVKIPVTVVIPVKNEEKNIRRCLAALVRFQRVVILDSSSIDKTVEIAVEAGAGVMNFEWNGTYPKKRNWFLLNAQLETEWVMFLDADEILSENVCEELASVLPNSDCAGYWLSYTNYFLGVPLHHGVPQRKLALMRVGAGLYERIDEENWSALDMEVHEHLQIDGKLGEILTRIDHDDYRGLDRFVDRHREYAQWEARRWRSLVVKGVDGVAIVLTKRQRFKYRNLEKRWYPAFYFVYTYFVRLGFLDGRAGFSYAAFKAWYFWLIGLLIAESNDLSKD